jgi:MYXO-CTERM domain-containing protein
MLARGLIAGQEGSLTKALDKLGTDQVDSDADGVTDLDELRAGTDPNVDGGESLMGAPPAYGCGARMAPGEGFEGWAALATALGLAVGLRRRSSGA